MTNREFHREHIVNVWNKLKNNIPLEGEERSLGEALGFHRELYPLFEACTHSVRKILLLAV